MPGRRPPISPTGNLSPEEIARVALGCIFDKKAHDVRALHVSEVSVLSDYFVIAGVENRRQAAAIADAIMRELKRRGLYALSVEGREDGWWTLIDYGSVVIHLMQDDARAFYDLDSFWGDAAEVQLEPIRPAEEAA